METTDLVEHVGDQICDSLWGATNLRLDEATADKLARAALEAAGVLALQAKAEKLEGVLKPFVRYADLNDLSECDPDDAIEVPVRDLLAARAALAEDYCGIVEVNEEDFRAEGERG